MVIFFCCLKLCIRLLVLLERRIRTFCALEVLVALFCEIAILDEMHKGSL